HSHVPFFCDGSRDRPDLHSFPTRRSSDLEAPGAAAVHCVVVGFDRGKGPARLFSYPDLRGEAVEAPAQSVNGYLVDGPNVLVEQRRTPLSPGLPDATFGNMPRDGGHLVVEAEEYAEVTADPVAAKYVRRYVGARELVRWQERWCLCWSTSIPPMHGSPPCSGSGSRPSESSVAPAPQPRRARWRRPHTSSGSGPSLTCDSSASPAS